MLEIRSNITGKKDTFGYFDGLVSKLDTAAERICKLEDIINKILKKQREQRTGVGWTRTDYPRTVGNAKSIRYM